MKKLLTGFDIGGTKCAVSIGCEENGKLTILRKETVPTDHEASPYEMIDRLADLAARLGAGRNVIGISCGGPLDSARGLIMSPPNLPGWDNIAIVSYLKDKYKTDAVLCNDANACALAEWKYGAGRGCRNMIFLTFGTGMGAGLILDGKLYPGTCDMAGEIGHVRMNAFGPVGYGKAGSFEGFCSGNGIAQLGRSAAMEKLQQGKTVSFCKSKAELSGITAKSIASCARLGETDARKIYETCGRMLGRGLSLLIDILNPERIVIGSIYVRCEDLLKDAMNEELARECLPASLEACRIVPAQLGEQIGDYAALSLASLKAGCA